MVKQSRPPKLTVVEGRFVIHIRNRDRVDCVVESCGASRIILISMCWSKACSSDSCGAALHLARAPASRMGAGPAGGSYSETMSIESPSVQSISIGGVANIVAVDDGAVVVVFCQTKLLELTGAWNPLKAAAVS